MINKMALYDSAWKDEMMHRVCEVCKGGVENWMAIIHTLGVPEVIRAEWCNTYITELKNVMTEMHNDLEERQKNVQKVILDLKSKVGELTFELGINAVYPQEFNLYLEEQALKSYLADLESQVKKKQEEVQVLLQRQEKICKVLGKPQKCLSERPLPSAHELEQFILHIEGLEDECFIREEKFANTQFALQSLVAEIEYEPTNEFEQNVIWGSDSPFEVNDKNMLMLNTFKATLQEYANNIKDEVAMFFEQLNDLWMTLETDEKYCSAFINSHKGYKKLTISGVKAEIKRLQDLKKANIGILVKRLQEQLVGIWDKCHFSEEQRREFGSFESEICTESMLTEIQNEIRKLTRHFDSNQALYELIQKYEGTWRRVEELETPVQGQNRYKNRGGKLLLEEKERRVARKRLEKLEQSILKMLDDYLKEHQEVFTYEGIPAAEYLKSFHAKEDCPKGSIPSSCKSILSATKSSNIIDGCKSVPKVTKSSHHRNQSPTMRNSPSSAKKDESKPQRAPISVLSQSAPAKGNNPILSRKNKAKKAVTKLNLKQKSKLIIDAIQQEDKEIFGVIHRYSHFQKIVDTTMPLLLNNTMESLATSSIQPSIELESPLAKPLLATPKTSPETQNHSKTDDIPTTPKSEFQNVTLRRFDRSSRI